MGKIQKIYSLAVAGNGNGLVGIGEGKATEYEDSQRIAVYMAVRNLEPIPRYEGRTIYGDVKVKVGAVELGLFTRPPGGFSVFAPGIGFFLGEEANWGRVWGEVLAVCF